MIRLNFLEISPLLTSFGHVRWIRKKLQQGFHCHRIPCAARCQPNRMISSASSRPSRSSYSRKCWRQVSIRKPAMYLESRLQALVSCCTHTLRRYIHIYIYIYVRMDICIYVICTYGRIAAQSNLELSLSNTSRVLGRCLRSNLRASFAGLLISPTEKDGCVIACKKKTLKCPRNL